MVIIHAYLKIKPSAVDLFLERSKALVAGSQAEEGNITYILCREVQNEHSFIVVEEWRDEEAVEIHNQMPHFKEFGVFLKENDILAEPPNVKKFKVEGD